MVYVTGLQLPVGIYSWAVTELLLMDVHCLSLLVSPAYFLGIAIVSGNDWGKENKYFRGS